MAQHRRLLQGRRIDPRPITGSDSVVELIENAFLAYNAARLREACQLFTRKMLAPDVTVGVSLTGALTPAGLGISALIPLIEHGFIDWIISTGANLYHDTHFGIGLSLHQGDPHMNDVVLRQEGIVRIYDIFFDYSVLLSTDAFFREIIASPEFQDIELGLGVERQQADDRGDLLVPGGNCDRGQLQIEAGLILRPLVGGGVLTPEELKSNDRVFNALKHERPNLTKLEVLAA